MKNFLRTKIMLLLALMLALMLCIACSEESTLADCSNIIDHRLTDLNFDGLSVSGARERIIQDLGIKNADISEEDGRIFWKRNGWTYSSLPRLSGSDYIRAILASGWGAKEPTIGQLLACAGSPTYYRAGYPMVPEGTAMQLELWYVDQGVVATAFITGGDRAELELGESTPLTRIIYTGGRTEETIAQVLPFQELRSKLQLWPGSLSKIVIEKDP